MQSNLGSFSRPPSKGPPFVYAQPYPLLCPMEGGQDPGAVALLLPQQSLQRRPNGVMIDFCTDKNDTTALED